MSLLTTAALFSSFANGDAVPDRVTDEILNTQSNVAITFEAPSFDNIPLPNDPSHMKFLGGQQYTFDKLIAHPDTGAPVFVWTNPYTGVPYFEAVGSGPSVNEPSTGYTPDIPPVLTCKDFGTCPPDKTPDKTPDPVSQIPEPGTFGLLSVAGLAALGRKFQGQIMERVEALRHAFSGNDTN